jgi:NADH-quinone oxidoreductase subunit C
MSRKERLRLKVLLESGDPVVESVTSVWPAANYFEREVFDLFGVRFSGHPYLRRLLMPEDWEGHPLRKDYPVEGYR